MYEEYDEELVELLDGAYEEIENADTESARSMEDCAEHLFHVISELQSLLNDDEYACNKQAIADEIENLESERTYALTCADEARRQNRQWEYDHPLGMPRYRYF